MAVRSRIGATARLPLRVYGRGRSWAGLANSWAGVANTVEILGMSMSSRFGGVLKLRCWFLAPTSEARRRRITKLSPEDQIKPCPDDWDFFFVSRPNCSYS